MLVLAPYFSCFDDQLETRPLAHVSLSRAWQQLWQVIDVGFRLAPAVHRQFSKECSLSSFGCKCSDSIELIGNRLLSFGMLTA